MTTALQEAVCKAWADAEDNRGRANYESAVHAARLEAEKRGYAPKDWDRDDEEWVDDFTHNDLRRGVWSRCSLHINGKKRGHIDTVRLGFLNSIYRTDDGKEFQFWGGRYGAADYLVARIYLFGTPPSRLRLFGNLFERLREVFG